MIDCQYIVPSPRFSYVDVPQFLISRSDDKERIKARQSTQTMLLTRFPLLALLALLTVVSTTSDLQQAVCEFQGDGTGEVEGWLLLREYETPDGTEIE